MRIGISCSTISMHLIMVFLIKIARKITTFNKIGSHVGFQISTKTTNLAEDHPVNISGKFG
jgi:hypothetical protein